MNMETPREYPVVTARVDPDVVERLERYLRFLNEREPGLNARMSTVVRMLIVRGLDQVEKEIGPLPPSPRKKAKR
jgi:hypothetical protein